VSSQNDQARARLRGYGLPEPPPGEVEDVRYHTILESWYVLMGGVWYWLDAREGMTKTWRPLPLGPIWSLNQGEQP
jgi:hypothetical protein